MLERRTRSTSPTSPGYCTSSPSRRSLHGGYIAVLTDGVEWFSAELINDPEEWTRIHSGISQLAISHLAVAAAVNGYADEATARRDAEKRITQDREARTR